MALEIKDATSGDKMKVGDDGRAHVESKTSSRLDHASRDDHRSFSIVSFDTAAAAEFNIYLQNDDTERDLVVDSVKVGAVVTTLWKLHEVTGTAAGGSVLTPKNLTVNHTRGATVTSRGDGAMTGLTTAGVLATVRTVANDHGMLWEGSGLRLPEGRALAVESDTTAGGLEEMEFLFHFEDAAS